MKNKLKVLAAIFSLMGSIACFASMTEQDLAKRIKSIEKQNNTVIGITAIHVEHNRKVAHNNNKRFFMASTIKVPIALAFMHRVDQRKESLDRVIKMDAKNSVPGSGSLHHLFEKKDLNMSLQQVLKHMMINSDNSASDTILHVVNGPKYVTQYMYTLGFKNIIVNRSILEMFLDTNHVDHALLNTSRPVLSWQKIFNHVPLSQKVASWERFQKDSRDTTTSDDMAQLLVKLQKKQILSDASTNIVLKIMEQCRTGRSRIRGMLPGNVKVAHKTGTWAISEPDYLRYKDSKQLYRFASDVGIITLPNNQGHIAIAIYVKSKSASDYPRSRSIALTSRAVYDFFMQRTTVTETHSIHQAATSHKNRIAHPRTRIAHHIPPLNKHKTAHTKTRIAQHATSPHKHKTAHTKTRIARHTSPTPKIRTAQTKTRIVHHTTLAHKHKTAHTKTRIAKHSVPSAKKKRSA